MTDETPKLLYSANLTPTAPRDGIAKYASIKVEELKDGSKSVELNSGGDKFALQVYPDGHAVIAASGGYRIFRDKDLPEKLNAVVKAAQNGGLGEKLQEFVLTEMDKPRKVDGPGATHQQGNWITAEAEKVFVDALRAAKNPSGSVSASVPIIVPPAAAAKAEAPAQILPEAAPAMAKPAPQAGSMTNQDFLQAIKATLNDQKIKINGKDFDGRGTVEGKVFIALCAQIAPEPNNEEYKRSKILMAYAAAEPPMEASIKRLAKGGALSDADKMMLVVADAQLKAFAEGKDTKVAAMEACLDGGGTIGMTGCTMPKPRASTQR